MLTIWDVVNEKNEDRGNRRRADALLNKFTEVIPKRQSKIISDNADIIQKYDKYIVDSALHYDGSAISFPDIELSEEEKKRYTSVVKHVYTGLTKFQGISGSIGERYECNEGWNNVISKRDMQESAYYEPGFYLDYFYIDNTLWLLVGQGNEYYLNDKYVMALIVMYIIGVHNKEFHPENIGLYRVYDFYASTLSVGNIHEKTLESIAKRYIGYDFSAGNVSWNEAGGESIERIKELTRHFDASGTDKCIWPHYEQKYADAKQIYNYYSELLLKKKDSIVSYIKEVPIDESELAGVSENTELASSEIKQYINEVAFSKSPYVGKIAVYYISDIHLEWHVGSNNELDELVQGLFTADLINRIKNRKEDYIVVFSGDISNTIALSKDFYTRFRSCWDSYSGEKAEKIPVYVVLGNHEYSEFDYVEDADKEYAKILQEIGITLLNNKQEIIKIGNRLKSTIMIVGGSGFAKYEPHYNCENIVGPRKMNRADEIAESEKFFETYKKAINNPLTSSSPIIVITHYPLRAWMPDFENTMLKQCLYFNGHDHRNTQYIKNDYHVYANNQIGYKKNAKIVFKKVLSGTITNPFIQYSDGVYEISSDKYLQFLNYGGESSDSVSLINTQLERDDSKLYMIKKHGFYGFFILSSKKGAYICCGTRYKKISDISDIAYYYENFTTIVNRYMMSLLPYRKAEEKISDAVRKLGFDGTIHGAIVDLDFFNHIMINPDGTITIYYSPAFGFAEKYDSFEQYLGTTGNKKAINTFKKEKDNQLMVLDIKDGKSSDEGLVEVDTSRNSMYGISRKIRNIERLFTSNVLREWDDSFAPVKTISMINGLNRKKFPSKLCDFESGRNITKRLEAAAEQLRDDIDYRNGETDLGTCLWAVAADSSLLEIVPEKYRTPEVCIKGAMIDYYYFSMDYRDYQYNMELPSWNNYSDDDVKKYMELMPKGSLRSIISDSEALQVFVDYFGKLRLFRAVPKELRNQELILKTLPDSFNELDNSEMTQSVYDRMGLYNPDVVPDNVRSKVFYANTVRLSPKYLKSIPAEYLGKEVYLAAIEKNRRYIRNVPSEMLDEKFILEAIKLNWRVIKELKSESISNNVLKHIENMLEYKFNSEMRKSVKCIRDNRK